MAVDLKSGVLFDCPTILMTEERSLYECKV